MTIFDEVLGDSKEERIENLLGVVDDLRQRIEALERKMAEFRPRHMKFDTYEAEAVRVFTENDFAE